MYTDFYKLNCRPFEIKPDPRFLFLSEGHREALAHLVYAVHERKGFTVITGDEGIGKTTLVLSLLKTLEDKKIRTACIFDPKLEAEDFLKMICTNLGLKTESFHSKGDLIIGLYEFILACHERDEKVVLVIDEAHILDRDLFEEVRLLTNLETPTTKLLQVILLGQPELDQKIDNPNLRQLKQRITSRYRLAPMNPAESRAYIDHRLQVAGSSTSRIFDAEALDLLVSSSGGIPRTINTVCDHALEEGHRITERIIDGKIAADVARDYGYTPPKPQREGFRKSGLLYVALGIAVVALLGIGVLSYFKGSPERVPSPPKEIAKPTSPPSALPQVEITRKEITGPAAPQPSISQVETASKEITSERQETRVVTVERDWTLSFLAQKYYHQVNPTILDLILEHNPQIKDMNIIVVNKQVKIPDITEEMFLMQTPGRKIRLYLGTFKDKQPVEAFEKNPVLKNRRVESTPRKVSADETWFRTTAGDFETREEGLTALRALKQKGLLPAFADRPKPAAP